MSISETLALVDKVTSPAQKMALAQQRLADATDKAAGALAAAGFDEAKFTKKTHQAVAEVERAKKAFDKLSGGAVKPMRREFQLAAPSVQALAGKDALGFIVGGSIATILTSVGQAVAGIAGKALDAAKAVASLVVEFGKGLVAAHLLRGESKAAMDALSGGRGEKVLAILKSQSIATGQSMEKLQKNVTEVREAGLGFTEAFKLNLLKADIEAATGSADKADKAVSDMLAKVKSGSTTAAKAMAKLKEEYGVAGDGALAHSKSATTLKGALDRLKNAPANIFDALAKNSGPKLDEIGGKVVKLVEDFQKSKEGKEIMAGIASAVESVLAAVSKAIPLVLPFVKGFYSGLKPILSALKPIGDALGKAFGDDNTSGMETAERVGRLLAVALGAVALVAGMVAAPFVLMGAAVLAAAIVFEKMLNAVSHIGEVPSLIGQAVNRAKAYLDLLIDAALGAGTGVIDGIVNGITGGIGRALAAAKQLGDKVKGALKDALQVHSPSKVGEFVGKMVGLGVAQGVEKAIPGAESAATGLGSSTAGAMAGGAAASSGGGSSGAPAFTLTLNVSANPGATQSDGEQLAAGIIPVIRREVSSWLEREMLTVGA